MGSRASIKAWQVRAVKIAAITTTAAAMATRAVNLCLLLRLHTKKSVERLQFPGPKDCDSKNYLDSIMCPCQESPSNCYWLPF